MDGRNDLEIYRTDANIMTKQSMKADKRVILQLVD
jgi:hypothetical protein